ncbi:hypothetical protein SNE40_008292 [Patella caerulea]|uniref:SGNH hydrolase-type esterase domain-containing protein n=1 Tax=Patella caerulea TaxID=87958 RepID=A0AAN8PUY3_PATCE
MATKKISTGNRFSTDEHVTELVSSKLNDNSTTSTQHNSKILNYELNISKCLKKKLKATYREAVTLKQTGGGLRIYWNSGNYEEFQRASEVYFTNLHQRKVVNVDVNKKVDKNERCESMILTVSSSKRGRCYRYTINLYNTTSSALVNGSGETVFLSSHFPEIIDLINDDRAKNINSLVQKSLCSKPITNDSNNIIDGSMSPNTYGPEMSLSSEATPSPDISRSSVSPIQINTKYSEPNVEIDETATPSGLLMHSKGRRLEINPSKTSTPSLIPRLIDITPRFKSKAVISPTPIPINQHTDFVELQSEITELKSTINGVNEKFEQISLCLKAKEEENLKLQNQIQTLEDKNMILNTTNQNLMSDNATLRVTNMDLSNELNLLRMSQKAEVTNDIVDTSYRPTMTQSSSRGGFIERHKRNKILDSQVNVVIGSSILRWIKPNRLDRSRKSAVRTISGGKIIDACKFLERCPASSETKKALFLIGSNNVTSSTNLSECKNDYLTLISTAKSKFPNAVIAFIELLPRDNELKEHINELNKVLEEVCDITKCELIKTAHSFTYHDSSIKKHLYDGEVHLNLKGTGRLASILKAAFNLNSQIPLSPSYASNQHISRTNSTPNYFNSNMTLRMQGLPDPRYPPPPPMPNLPFMYNCNFPPWTRI